MTPYAPKPREVPYEITPRPGITSNLIKNPLKKHLGCDHKWFVIEELSPTLVVVQCDICALEEEQNR